MGKVSLHKRAFDAWRNAIQRCGNPKHPHWLRYGGRGITVCDRWKAFDAFLEDMGDPPLGTTIERINNDKGYAPGNCRWATPKEQSANKGNQANQKLTPQKVIQMRLLRNAGQGYREIADLFDIDPMTCHRAINRKTWKHVV